MTDTTTTVGTELTWYDLHRLIEKRCRTRFKDRLNIEPRIVHGIMMHIPNENVSMGLSTDKVLSGPDAENKFDGIVDFVEELRRVEVLSSVFRIMWH